MPAEGVLYAATEYPREPCDAADVTSVGSKVGDACAKKDEWPQSVFAVLEMHKDVS